MIQLLHDLRRLGLRQGTELLQDRVVERRRRQLRKVQDDCQAPLCAGVNVRKSLRVERVLNLDQRIRALGGVLPVRSGRGPSSLGVRPLLAVCRWLGSSSLRRINFARFPGLHARRTGTLDPRPIIRTRSLLPDSLPRLGHRGSLLPSEFPRNFPVCCFLGRVAAVVRWLCIRIRRLPLARGIVGLCPGLRETLNEVGLLPRSCQSTIRQLFLELHDRKLIPVHSWVCMYLCMARSRRIGRGEGLRQKGPLRSEGARGPAGGPRPAWEAAATPKPTGLPRLSRADGSSGSLSAHRTHPQRVLPRVCAPAELRPRSTPPGPPPAPGARCPSTTERIFANRTDNAHCV